MIQKESTGIPPTISKQSVISVVLIDDFIDTLELFEVLPRVANVDECDGGWDVGVGHHDHRVRVGRERVDERRESVIANLHTAELRVKFRTGEFELFDDVGDLLEAVDVFVGFALTVRDDQEGGTLEQQHLVGADDLRETLQVRLERSDVRDEFVYDRTPRPVQRLVPNRRAEQRAL